MFVSGAAEAAPAVPAAESTLGSHPCVALSSAQVLPEWINRHLADNRSAANGDNPLNFVSHPRGSLHLVPRLRLAPTWTHPCICRYDLGHTHKHRIHQLHPQSYRQFYAHS